MTVDSTKFEKYKKIKERLSFNENGIEFNHVLTFLILRIIYHKQLIRKKEIIGQFFKTLDLVPFVSALGDAKPLFTDAVYRPDHYNLITLVRKDIDHNYVREEGLKRSIKISLKNLITSFFFIRKSVKNDLGFFDKICLWSALVYYRNVADDLRKNTNIDSIKCNKYISFCSPFGIESLFTQFLNKFNIPTYTLSHGLSYVRYRKELPLDIVNGENITSKYVFVWGENSRSDLQTNFSFSIDRIIVAGNPKYAYRKINVKKSFNTCIVLLGRLAYHEGNILLLKIASDLKRRLGIEIHIRLHISLSTDFYKELCNNLNLHLSITNDSLHDLFNNDQYDFAIVNNSTTYYEAMYYNMPCFRYAVDENEIYSGLDDKFEDLPQLLSKIDYFKSMNQVTLNNVTEKLLVESLGMGLNKYKEVIENDKEIANESIS